MKLFEVAIGSVNPEFQFRNGKDINNAIKATLMHDWIDVGIEADPKLSTEQGDEDHVKLSAIIKKIIKHKPGSLGSMYLHFDAQDSVQLKKILDAFNAYFGEGEWRWVCTVEGMDEET
jgi:hypothetical protein